MLDEAPRPARHRVGQATLTTASRDYLARRCVTSNSVTARPSARRITPKSRRRFMHRHTSNLRESRVWRPYSLQDQLNIVDDRNRGSISVVIYAKHLIADCCDVDGV